MVEREIATAFIKSTLGADHEISVDNGDEESEKFCDQTSVLGAMFQTDEDRLYIWKQGKRFGWAYFVYGNGGWDVLSDYTTNLESLMGPVNEVIKKYED
jgi:hypothetical protein